MLTGQRENPLGDMIGKVDIGWNITRSPLVVAGRNDAMTVTTTINGYLNAVGQLNQQASQITSKLGNMLGGNIGREFARGAAKPFDQRLDINGNVAMTAKPMLLPNWRFEPNLSASVALVDRAVNIGGSQLNVIGEVKPHLDRAVNEQMAKLEVQVRNDPTLEQTARREWAKICRSVSLGPAGPDMPALWLEVKPVRALAAQPKIDPNWLIVTLGIHAETRIVPSETKPNCPFPAQLEIVPPMDQGKIAIGVPIELPFTELNRLMEVQLKGKTFPEEADAPVHVTVQKATLAASGDRLLISLKVKANEKKSWFGLGADADVFIWGKPVLDSKAQILRFTDMTLDVESESAFGLAGAAARAAIPYVQKMLEQQAVVDLKPIAATALKNIDAALARLPEAGRRRQGGGRDHRHPPHRHRVRRQDPARHRRGRRHRAGAGDEARGAVARSLDPPHPEEPPPMSGLPDIGLLLHKSAKADCVAASRWMGGLSPVAAAARIRRMTAHRPATSAPPEFSPPPPCRPRASRSRGTSPRSAPPTADTAANRSAPAASPRRCGRP